MNTYHIDFGNSTSGAVGAVLCIKADSPEAALEAAQEKLEKFTAAMGHPCFILECAIKNGVDYCTRCDKFPCDVHYKQGLYSKSTLDMLKGMLANK